VVTRSREDVKNVSAPTTDTVAEIPLLTSDFKELERNLTYCLADLLNRFSNARGKYNLDGEKNKELSDV
jgi:hypothetical protein